MTDALYLRRILIALGLVVLVSIAIPLLTVAMALLGCQVSASEDCAILGMVFLIGVGPLAAVLVTIFLAWVMTSRSRSLGLPWWLTVFAALVSIACARFVLTASFLVADAISRHHSLMQRECVPLILALAFAAALYWVPARQHRSPAPMTVELSFAVVALLLLLRLADVVLYPIPGLLILSFELERLGSLGPLKLAPLGLLVVAFVALGLALVWRWRVPIGEAPD